MNEIIKLIQSGKLSFTEKILLIGLVDKIKMYSDYEEQVNGNILIQALAARDRINKKYKELETNTDSPYLALVDDIERNLNNLNVGFEFLNEAAEENISYLMKVITELEILMKLPLTFPQYCKTLLDEMVENKQKELGR